jgi:hypothetical protein
MEFVAIAAVKLGVLLPQSLHARMLNMVDQSVDGDNGLQTIRVKDQRQEQRTSIEFVSSWREARSPKVYARDTNGLQPGLFSIGLFVTA